MIRRIGSALALLWGVANIDAETLVEKAYEAGQLDLGTALIYQLEGMRDQTDLPTAYREVMPRALFAARRTSCRPWRPCRIWMPNTVGV